MITKDKAERWIQSEIAKITTVKQAKHRCIVEEEWIFLLRNPQFAIDPDPLIIDAHERVMEYCRKMIDSE